LRCFPRRVFNHTAKIIHEYISFSAGTISLNGSPDVRAAPVKA